MPRQPAWFGGGKPLQSDITTAVAWRFTQHNMPEIVPAADYPRLAAHSARAETLPAFMDANF
jgi:glutathione S-transferase